MGAPSRDCPLSPTLQTERVSNGGEKVPSGLDHGLGLMSSRSESGPTSSSPISGGEKRRNQWLFQIPSWHLDTSVERDIVTCLAT